MPSSPSVPCADAAANRDEGASGCPNAIALLLFSLVAGAVAVLSFADGAPGLARDVLRGLVPLAGVVEDVTGVEVGGARGGVADWDVLGHAVLWFGFAVAAWSALRRWCSVPTLGFALFVASYATEIGQRVLSETRTPDPRDLVANTVGTAFGLSVCVVADRVMRTLRRGRRAGRLRR